MARRWKTGLFITLLLDCNVVNALSAHQEVGRLQYGGGTNADTNDSELAKDVRYNKGDCCGVRLTEHGLHHNSYFQGSQVHHEEARLGHERLPGDALWLFRLGEALQVDGDIECIDEGRVLYVRTWYVDHRDGQHYESRVVRITEQDSFRDWYANIIETWSDTIPRLVRIDVTLVEPKPPRIRFDEATTEHILLTTFREEAQPARRIAGVVSVVIGGEVRRQCTVLYHEGASTSEILDASGAAWSNAGIIYRVDGVPINNDPNVPWYGRSWTYFATLSEEQSDFVAFGQVSIRAHPGKQCRPNPELTMLPDDNIPHDLYYRSDNVRVQGRVIPPPNWRDHVTLASASYNGAVRRDEENLPWVHLKTWVLCYTRFCPRESRNLMIRAQLLVQLNMRVRQKWSDYIFQQDTVKLVIVKPTPAPAHGERQRLNIIAEVSKPPTLRTKPALFSFQQLSADGPEPFVLWVVASVGHSVTLQQVAQLHGSIEPAQILVPQGTQDRRWMSAEDSRVLAPGHYVPVWWRTTPITPAGPSQTTQGDEQSLFQHTVVESRISTGVEDPPELHSSSFAASVDSYSVSLAVTDWMITGALAAEDPNLLRNDRGNCLLWEQSNVVDGDNAYDDDETIFMQRTSEATTTARTTIRLIGLHRLTGLVTVDPDRTLQEQLQEVWPFQFTAYDQVNTIFRVSEPLTYATSGPEQVYILQLQDDHFEQVHEDDVLTLLSIRYTNPNSISDNKLRVRVVWAPARTTRAALLQWLRLHWYCDRATVLCHIFINSELWGEGDMTVRSLQSGDHCRIQIISAAEDLCDIEHSERLARRQRLIMSSDDEADLFEQANEDDAATSAHGSHASRSTRSRSRRRGDGLALLQVHAAIVGTTQWENNGMITGYRNGTEDPNVLTRYWHCHTLRHGVEEMITGFSRFQTESEEPHHNNVFVDRFQRLSPPGNGVQSFIDLNSIDDWLWEDGKAVAVDYQASDDPLDARSAPSPPVKDSGKGHIEADSEEPDMRLPVDQTLWLTYAQLIDGDAAVDVDIPNLEWQPATAALLPQWIKPQIAPHEEFFIYTDGSAGCYHEGTSAIPKAHWAFAVWTTFKGKRSLMHHARGHVPTDRQDCHWHGTDKATSLEAERAALIAATVWANRVLVAYRMPISFCFDNVAAGFGSSGQWHIQRCHSDAVLLRCMMQTLEEQSGQQPNYIHVKAHEGDAYNEFVDVLAYDALQRGIQQTPLDFDIRSVLQEENPMCAHWPLLARTTFPTTTMPRCCQGHIGWSYPKTQPDPQVVWKDLVQVEERSTSVACLQLRCVTYNVRSLKEDGQLVGLGITAFLRSQLEGRHYDIVFLQETRARHSCIQETADFRRYISASTPQGHGGTEIWLSKNTRWAPDNVLKWKLPLEAVILHSTPECLIIHLGLHGKKLVLISAHGPHGGKAREEVQQWWDDMDVWLGRHVGQAALIMGIDANAHFNETTKGCVGVAGLEERQNYPATQMVQCISRWGMWIPSTYEHIHFGPHGTWYNPHLEKWHRCDYLVLSGNFFEDQIKTWVDGNLDTGGGSMDHVPVALQLDANWQVKTDGTMPKKRHIDVLALKSATSQQVEKALQRSITISWDADIHEHGARFVEQIRNDLAEAFPAQRKGPYRDYITKETWDLRGQRRTLRKHLYQRRQRIHGFDVCAAFYCMEGRSIYRDMLGQWQRMVHQSTSTRHP